jgi:DNA-binding protein YbaB
MDALRDALMDADAWEDVMMAALKDAFADADAMMDDDMIML